MPGHFLRRPSLALSAAEEEAKWPHLQAAIRISAMEEEARQQVEDAEAWAFFDQVRAEEAATRRQEDARLRREEKMRQEARPRAEERRQKARRLAW
jgi:hypothetical protein